MKKALLLSMALLSAISGFGQNLAFEGIPIQGQKTRFVQKLKDKGYNQYSDTTYVGKYFTYDSCIIKPIANADGEMLAVALVLPPFDNWTDLNVAYNVLREKLKKVFGEIGNVKEQFDTPNEPYTANEKYEALNNGKCWYQTSWATDDGALSLLINHWESGENVVQVVYMKMDFMIPNLPHMKFKGVPFDIPSDEFVSKLKRQGYKYVARPYNDYILMTGDFAGYSDCNIYINVVLPDDVIGTVAVSFPNQSRWSHLQSTYNNIKSMLIKKYGEPSSCTEVFDSYRQPTSEYDAMILLRQDKYRYETKFYVEGGIIQLNINRIYVDYEHIFYVSLTYYDMGNQNKSTKNAIDDL